MAKFMIVDKAPENLKEDEMVVKSPNFLDEIKRSNAKASGKRMTSLHHMRQILMLIGNKYDPNGTFNSYTSIPLTKFEGLAFDTDEDLNQIIIRMLNKHYPVMLDLVVESQIKSRRPNVKLIYFEGNSDNAGPFFKHGIPRTNEVVSE